MSSLSSHNGEKHLEVCCCGCAQHSQELMVRIGSLSQQMNSFQTKLDQVLTIISAILQDSTPPVASRSFTHQGESSASKRFRLCIHDACLPDTLFTVDTLKDQCGSLTVELLDESGSRVVDGLESAAKIKFSVLHGASDPDEWTEEEFIRNVVLPREGKGDLLKGTREISLDRGVAEVTDISFTDNTNRDGIMLCVQVLKPPPGVYIRRAVSKRFTVKERRGKRDAKHDKPFLDDELWRLQRIRRDGNVYKRAEEKNICKVKDFLQLYYTDPKELRKILDVNDKDWKKIVDNAKECVLSSEHYRYSDEANGVELVLNCVFEIASYTTLSGQLYESLGDHQKKIVDEVRRAAYEKRDGLEPHIPTNVPGNQMQSPADQMPLHTNVDQIQPQPPSDQMLVNTSRSLSQKHTNANMMQMHTNVNLMQMHSSTSQMNNNENLMQMHTGTSQTQMRIHANQIQVPTASQMQMQTPAAASHWQMYTPVSQMHMHNPVSQIQTWTAANQQMHVPASQIQMRTPTNQMQMLSTASQMQMPAELPRPSIVPVTNESHLNDLAPNQGIPTQFADSFCPGFPLDHCGYDEPCFQHEAAFDISDCFLRMDFVEELPVVPDIFQATTSSAPSVVAVRNRWLRAVGAVKIKLFVCKVLAKQSHPPRKRKKLSSD